MDLLYRSFQAKLARGDFNNSSKKQQQQQQQQQHSSDKSSTVSRPPMKSNPTKTTIPNYYQQQQQQQQLQQLQQLQQQQQLHNGHHLQCSNTASILSHAPPVITTSPMVAADLAVSQMNQTMTNYSNLAAANSQAAFLQQQQQQQQQNVLAMSQHPFYATSAFAGTNPASLFQLPPQFLWPGQLGMVPTSSAATFGTAYPPPPQAALPSAGSLIQPETFAYFQNNPYLAAQIGLKRPHIGDYEEEGSSKRLRLTTIPY